mmetsp:Transcript_16531/g.26855  ORF Transcript_16531/g.26855 Transcript_16531/m.26855 type:complete len:135 (+) Transcript_16531:515-919(+)
MKCVAFIVVLVLGFSQSISGQGFRRRRRCGRNEQYFEKLGPCEGSCTSPGPVCFAPNPHGCYCQAGYVRNSKNVCQKAEACVKCGKNEEFKFCSTCEPTCDNPQMVCTKECKPPKCQCKTGFIRGPTGTCTRVC